MRDVRRIGRILKLIKELWMKEECQDQRFFQLLTNYAPVIKYDLWHYEDDDFEKHLKKLLRFKRS